MAKKGITTLGYGVDRNALNLKSADAVMTLRLAFSKVESIAKWLANNPKVGDVDPLVEEFEYTEDEAYVLRHFFGTFNNVRLSNAEMFDVGRAMTGLE